MTHYHFDIGNSSTGPIGMCARVVAENKQEAVTRLHKLLEEHSNEWQGVMVFETDEEYVQIYLNAEPITEKDIDGIDDDDVPTEEDKRCPPPA